MRDETLDRQQDLIEYAGTHDVLTQLNSGQLLVVNSRRRNGLIIYKRFHAEFAGTRCRQSAASLMSIVSVLFRWVIFLWFIQKIRRSAKKLTLIRRQWIRLTQQLTDNPVPLQRAQMILNQFENYFGAETVAQLPDEAFALLVGVLPQTIRMMRRNPENLELRLRF